MGGIWNTLLAHRGDEEDQDPGSDFLGGTLCLCERGTHFCSVELARTALKECVPCRASVPT